MSPEPYLEQYITGDVKELIKSCHHLPPDVGYEQVSKLLEKKFGDEYRVASAYESKALAWPPIKAEDCTALNKVAIFLSSCKNALGEVSTLRNLTSQGTLRIDF